MFYTLHLIVGIWKRIASSPSFWVANVCLSLATSIFSFSFETWAVVEHDKVGAKAFYTLLGLLTKTEKFNHDVDTISFLFFFCSRVTGKIF